MYKTISPFFYYSDLKRYEHTKSFIGHQYYKIYYLTLQKWLFRTVKAWVLRWKRAVFAT